MTLHRHIRSRRGLAPLELVLCLPLLMLMMAVVINFGTVACWKVRSLSVAREKAFASRWPRVGAADDRFEYWPSSASAGTNSFSISVEGPALSALTGNDTLLDPSQSFVKGTSGLTRGYPLLGSMGSYELNAAAFVLENQWQFRRMGKSQNLAYRLTLYDWPPSSVQDSETLKERYKSAVMAMLQYLSGLRQLEPWAWNLRITNNCTLDTEAVQEAVEQLIDRIDEDDDDSHLGGRRLVSAPKTVARRLINKYKNELSKLQSSENPDQSAVKDLQGKIDALNDFLGKLN